MAERSVSRAALRLRLTQSAVGDALFIRTPKGIKPTTLAESISGRVHTALSDIRGILTPESVFEPSRTKQRFKLGMTDYVSFAIMPGLARSLQHQAPGAQVIVLPASARASVGMIERGEIDLYIGAPPPDAPDFIATAELFTDDSVCVARRGHPAFGRKFTASDFLACSHLHVSPWGETGFIDEMLSRQGTERRIALTVGHFLVVPSILERADLIAVLPRRLALPLTRRYALAMRASPLDLGVSRIVQVWHRRFDADAGLTWMREKIAASSKAPLSRTTAADSSDNALDP